jgi:phosphatidylglycerol:prolipoprotein diacylglycerol transferase
MDLLVIPYPVIDPVALQIGPVSIRWYGLAYMAGILLGWLYGRYLVSRPELWGGKPAMTVPQADDFLLWITLGIVLGGRLGFVLFYEPSYFWEHPAEIPAVWNGGMSFHGGLLGVALAVYLFAKIKGINGLSLGDVASASTPFGLFFGRIANFINSGRWWGASATCPGPWCFPAPAISRAIRASSTRRRSKAWCCSSSCASPRTAITR